MPQVTAALVKELRDRTGAGMMECKRTLTKTGGDMEKAVDELRKAGRKVLEKKAGRAVNEGRIGSYVHAGKIGVLVEVCCETDFVAATDAFKTLADDIAMQIAAMNPRWILRSDVDDEAVEREKAVIAETLPEGKPQAVLDKIIDGRMKKFYEERCLLDQPFIKDDTGKLTVHDYVAGVASELKENIMIRRFTRFQLGGD